MSDRDEHNADIDREYWSEDIEPFEFEPDISDVTDWILESDELGDFLADMDRRVRENKGATIYVMLADWLDEHQEKIKKFING